MTTCQWGAVLGASLAAAIWDVRTTRIPNVLTATLAILGLLVAAASAGLTGFGEAMAAWVSLALPYIILFLLGQGGAGDAKMMGAIGTWLGMKQGMVVLCCVAMTGGILAIIRILLRKDRKMLLCNLVASLYVYLVASAIGSRGWSLLRVDAEAPVHQQPGQVTFPYGVAIFLGVCLGGLAVHVGNIG